MSIKIPSFVGNTKFAKVDKLINLPSHIKNNIYTYLERDDKWKNRFTNDVLSDKRINKGIRYIGVCGDNTFCLQCYEDGPGENHFYYDYDEQIIEDHSYPQISLNFEEYKYHALHSRITLVTTNYYDFTNWLSHWNGVYSTVMRELISKTYKHGCCHEIHACGGKAYYDGWLCRNMTPYERSSYISWAGEEDTGGRRVIDEVGEFRVVVGTLDYNLSRVIKHKDCLFTDQKDTITDDEIAMRYLKYKLIISPVNYIFENYSSDSSKINIDAETIRNHDKCVFQINHMLGTRILDLDKPFRPADLLLINGYFSGYFINFEMNLNINQFNEEYNKNHILHSDNVKAFNRYLEDYLV